MKYGRIGLKGINRSIASQKVPDGWMDELINLRHDKAGNLVPVGLPTKIWNVPLNDYSSIWHHDQDNVDNYVGQNLDNSGLYILNMETGAATLLKSYSLSVRVEFLKRFMIVSYETGMDVFWWNDGVYNLVVMPGNPIIEFGLFLFPGTTALDIKYINTDRVGREGSLVLGKYYKAVNEQSKEGYHTGGIMFRAAFKMFDGSYVFHTLPQYVELGIETKLYEYSDNTISLFLKFGRPAYQANTYQLLTMNSDLFTHLTIFACKNETLYEISEDTITDDLLQTEITATSPTRYDFSEIDSLKNSLNSSYKEMADSSSWYKVHEISIKDLQEGEEQDYAIDMSDFYQDYATREVLTVDQFSHHKLIAKTIYNFNSRLHMGEISTVFGDYGYYPLSLMFNWVTLGSDNLYMPNGYTFTTNRNVRFAVTLNTSYGDIMKVVNVGSRPFGTNGLSECLVLAKSIVGYPDARASKIDVLVQNGSNWHLFGTINLKKSVNDNYSYYHTKTFDGVDYFNENVNYGIIYLSSDYPSSSIININSYLDDEYIDQNRVQVSEVNNPLFYPAENSYQVGTGKILAFGTNTEPLSQGQFGQHPMIVFTSKGIYVLLQGSGEILYSAILPLNGEIPNNPDKIVSVSTGVVYTTDEGLYIISGASVQELSKDLTGRPNLYLQDVENYTARIDHTQFVQLVSNLSTIDAKLYIAGANFGFNYTQKELVVSNPNYDYSYVYSFLSGTWHKISESFKTIIRSYPKLLVVSENASNSGVFDLTLEQDSTYIDTLFTTRPCNVEEGGSILFTLIHRAILRCELNTGVSTFAGFYVFGSNDLKTWQLFQGSDNRSGEITDLFCLRSHLKVKYFVFVFAANLKEGESFLNELDLQYYHKLTNKIR